MLSLSNIMIIKKRQVLLMQRVLRKLKHYLNRLVLSRYERVQVKAGEAETSTSDNGWYVRSIESFLKSNKKFNKFKRSPAYREVLEHTSYEQACQYLERIKSLSPELLEKHKLAGLSLA